MKEIIIIGIVAVAACGCRRQIVDVKSTRANMATIATAIDMFEVDREHLPATLDELLPTDPKWQGTRGYVKTANSFVDGWGTKYQYHVVTNQYELRSAGPDRTYGTGDDIVIGKGTPNQPSQPIAGKPGSG
jgi:hypothetical protein